MKIKKRENLWTHRSVVKYSHIIRGARVMMKNPSVIIDPSGRVPEKTRRLDLMVLELTTARKVFRRLP